MLPMIHIVVTVLISLFFLIPGFVSENFQVARIICDKFSSKQVFFSLSLFFSFTFFMRLYSVCLCDCMGIAEIKIYHGQLM